MAKYPDIIFEFKRIGAITKVIAIDGETGTEVSIQGPTNAGTSGLQTVAAKKLMYVLDKMNKSDEESK